ncbi:hypothetical protein FSP39_015265 [Pinctada imbricata]|uniref:SWI/SNF-related matrix-associated actin-dependent regulator of chromatin subfamily A-like protein 1 n=1 Tax=Pinctada imbricata TaxID=66713 RepID=A0AA88YNZ7_PINIB|nr:hypothetical protein FSP39_015265 [Pinctada imbricata]
MSSLTEDQRKRIEENKRRALAKRAQKSSPVKGGDPPIITEQSTVQSRIEENKRKALAIRAQKLSPVKASASNSTTCSAFPQSRNFSDLANKDSGIQPNNKTGLYANSVANSFTNSAPTFHSSKTSSTQHGNNGGPTSTNKHSVSMQGNQNFGQRNFNSSTNQTIHNRAQSQQLIKNINKNSIGGIKTQSSGSSASSSNTTGTCAGSSSTFGTVPMKFGSNVKGKCVLISRERFEVQVGFSAPVVEVFKSMNTKLYDAVTKKWSFKLEEYEPLLSALRKLGSAVVIEPLPKAIIQTFSAQLKGKYSSRDIPIADLSMVDNLLVNSLLPFQREGVNFGVHKNGRVLIADDMGLGKTIQAICLACVYRREWPLLVVVPSSVRFDWAQQIQRWVPSLDPQQIFVAVKGSDGVSEVKVNILSYDLMARKAKDLQKKNFQVVIMDECHLLKNFKTARCKAARPLLQNARRVILLSGTPALSRPSELFTQIDAVCPFLLKYHDFGVRYCDGKQNPWGWDFSGSSNMEELQLVLEEKIMIRRLKKEVLTQLPSKVRQMVVLDPGSIKTTKDMKRASKVMGLEKLKGMERRGALLDYFHQTGNAKLNAVTDYVLDLLESDRKFILFAHHQEVLDGVEDAVRSKISNGYIRIDGKTTPEQRNFFCKKFQTNDDTKVAILSITAANAGLNMSAASLVLFAELFWNPGILVQAEDRAHRIGQRDMVSVQYLVAQGTADDHIWPLVQKKLDVLNKGGLSKDDFSSADTVRVTDSKQTDLMQFFEESFIDEDNSFMEDEDNTNSNTVEFTDTDTCSSKETKQSKPTCLSGSSSASSSKQGSLFSYYNTKDKPKDVQTVRPDSVNNAAGVRDTKNNCNDGEFVDDLDPFLDDPDWDNCDFEPEYKKQKL